MVNASLNWASIVGIVLAVSGLFFAYIGSNNRELSSGTESFIAAVLLLCGGILFFQGWRLDPILQFGQFLLALVVMWVSVENIQLRRKLVKRTGISISQSFNEEQYLDERVDDDSSDWNNSSTTSYTESKRSGLGLKCSYCGARVD